MSILESERERECICVNSYITNRILRMCNGCSDFIWQLRSSCVHKKTKKSKECVFIREICKKVLEQPGKKIYPSNASLYPFSMEAGHQ